MVHNWIKAFTLVELLVVVLIIGVLTSIALPMYQGAVDKSHWSTMLPGAKAIKDAEEAIKMTNGEYTSQMDDLDVTMNNENLNFTLTTPNNMSDPNVIRVTNPKLANVRLASYLDDSPMFAGQLHCEALKTDDRANRLCGKLLNGEELTLSDGYTGYLLDQSITKEICGDAGRSWSSSKTTCYKDTATRCEALGMGIVAGKEEQCGYTNTGGKTIGAEGMCVANSGTYACSGGVVEKGGICLAEAGSYTGCSYNMIVRDGGVCQVDTGNHGCTRIIVNEGGICRGTSGDACWGSTFNSGGICIGEALGSNPRGCEAAIINSGAKCIAKTRGACNATYNGTGCCEEGTSGETNCPKTAPKC